MARKQRRDQAKQRRRGRPPSSERPQNGEHRALLLLRDSLFYLRQGRWLLRSGITIVGVVLVMFVVTTAFSGRIYANVSAMGVDIGGLNPEQATETLRAAWAEDLLIDVVVNGDVIDQLQPAQLGLQLDAAATAAAARDLSFRFGLVETPITPVVTLPDSGYLAVQNYLLNLSDTINQAPVNPGFQWQNEVLVTTPARPG
ncbi:MAG: hypothetical protein AAF125_04280, partial [Chloroflexota bacterium]